MDALQFTLALDDYMEKALENLAPAKNTYSLNGVREIDDALEHPKPVVATTANWYQMQEDPDPEILPRMLALAAAPPPPRHVSLQ